MLEGLKRGLELLKEESTYNYEEELLMEELIRKFEEEINTLDKFVDLCWQHPPFMVYFNYIIKGG